MLPQLKNLTDLQGKRVLVRVDFNVPLKDGQVSAGGEWRIKAVLPTLDYLLDQGAKIIILSHLGRPQDRHDLKYSLYPIFLKLSQLWPRPRLFFGAGIFEAATKKQIKALKENEVILLENLRFYPEEEENDFKFAKKISQLGDIFVNDAFAVSHRAHASIVGLPKFLESAAGFLLERELLILGAVKTRPRRPLVLVMGGAKVETKLKLVKEFLNRPDEIILGGVLANTLLYAQGISVGRSLIEKNLVKKISRVEITSRRLHLPVDVVASKSLNVAHDVTVKPIGRIGRDEYIIDIGPESAKLFSKIIKSSRLVIWNGALGLTEVSAFKKGSLSVAEAIVGSSAEKIIGGGDLINFLAQEDLLKKMDYVSTGGGAMMEYLAGEELPGVRALSDKL